MYMYGSTYETVTTKVACKPVPTSNHIYITGFITVQMIIPMNLP